ncbi:MAG: c-type cytochrome domain-containing protein [Verrucomicrobiota bacterium]
MQIRLLLVVLLGAVSCGNDPQIAVHIDFETEIYPLIKASCADCHRAPYKDKIGRIVQPDGALVVTEKRGLLEGGELGEVIVPGRPDQSEFLALTLLPLDDEDHMPPEGEAPEWTDAEKELVKNWIKQGADFGGWERDPEFD